MTGVLRPALLLLLAALTGAACRPAAAPRSADARLEALWRAYLRAYVRDSGEVVDPLRDGRVSSEAQSYAMVRAVWMRDRDTFERVDRWTARHLRREDGLHAWLWDPTAQRIVDANSATDGDVEIAFALAMASVVFERPEYATRARDIVLAIRTHASMPVGDGEWFPSAGNWAGPERIVNLSYFYPYATPWFDRLDPEGGWSAVATRGYALVGAALAAGPVSLPADFAVLRPDGRLAPLPPGHMLSAVFSYDSIRIPWRMDLACRLHGDKRACELAATLGGRLAALYARDGEFVTRYDPRKGVALNRESSLSFAGALLPAVQRAAPPIATALRAARLDEASLDTLMRADDRYYDANWVWFGLAAVDGSIAARTPKVEDLRLP